MTLEVEVLVVLKLLKQTSMVKLYLELQVPLELLVEVLVVQVEAEPSKQTLLLQGMKGLLVEVVPSIALDLVLLVVFLELVVLLVVLAVLLVPKLQPRVVSEGVVASGVELEYFVLVLLELLAQQVQQETKVSLLSVELSVLQVLLVLLELGAQLAAQAK